MFVGLVELMLEFVKPVTLSMRLFGNIYGGEVALGVITALTLAFIPVGLLGLEVMLNAIQALIFSILSLMFIVLAIESHHEEEGHDRRGGARRRPRQGAVGTRSPPTDAPDRRNPTTVPIDPGRPPRGVGGNHDMDYFGAGLAALGVFGPGIGIGILGGLLPRRSGATPMPPDRSAVSRSSSRPSRRASASSRSSSACSRSSSSQPTRHGVAIVDILAVATAAGREAVRLGAEGAAEPLFQVNLFWVIVTAANSIVFFVLIWTFAFKPVSKMLDDRKARIEQGLKDAEQARKDRENAESERVATLAEARRESNEILARAQKVAQELRDADIAATREELERMRVRAAAEIEAEKHRAIGELRAEVADLALEAASRVVGETMTGDRQRRLVEEFLRSSSLGESKN